MIVCLNSRAPVCFSSRVEAYESESSVMRRRAFITLLGGAATAPAMIWPLAARAQTGERMRRVGVLMLLSADDPVARARIAAFVQGLGQLGWIDGRNLRIDYRWTVGSADQLRSDAAELVALAPDVILATGSPPVAALQQASRSVPIVFVLVSDPVGAGYVASLGRPGGSTTGFTPFEYSTSAKLLELLKEIAPAVTRVAVIGEPTNPGAVGQIAAIRSAAPTFGVELSTFDGRDGVEVERAITTFARSSNGGLIVPAIPSANLHRELIIALAAQHRLPAVYGFRLHVVRGGLISYGPDQIDQYRFAAGYVDRILRGEKPGDLPVQAPTRYDLVINLKTAKALRLDVPPMLLARADEVIE
jgi:putative ABC transport system substrate-binding protein